MAQKLETDIVINLAGNLAAKAKRYGNSMSDFARKNERAMTLVRTTTAAAGRGIDRLGNRYVGLATTFATGAAVRGVGNFEEQMTRIGTNAKLTDEQVKALTKSVQDVSNQKNVRIDTTQIAAGVDTLLGKTGDLKFTMDNLQNMGEFMQAFGADAQSTGALFAQFREKGITDSKAVMKTIDQLYGQFAIGSVSVKDLAGISEQLFATYQGQGSQAITQMGALAQLFAKSKGNANEALTSIQAVFAVLQDKKNVQFLNQQGIKVFKDGTTELRKPVELLLEILDKAKNDPLKLGDVFDQTSLQGLAALYSEKNKDLLRDMVSGNAELGATQKAAAKNAATFNSAMTSLNNSFQKFANEELAGPIKELADAINGVDQETVQNWLKWGEAAVYAIGGVIVAKKALDAGMWAKKTFGTGGIAGGLGKGGINSLGATPVYVVNMGQGGLGNGGIEGGGKNGTRGVVGKVVSVLSRGAAISSAAIYSSSLNDGEDRQVEDWKKNGYPKPFVQSKESLEAAQRYSDLLNEQQTGIREGYHQTRRGLRPNRPSISELANNLDVSQPSNISNYINQLMQGVSGSSNSDPLFKGNIGMDLNVYDHRIESKVRSKSPFISIEKDPDAGQN